MVVSHPDPPPKRKGGSGEYSMFLYLPEISVAQSDWLIWQLTHLHWASSPQTTLTPLQIYLAHFQYLLKPQQATSKA